jgi:diguanylate cyclase (GGDEF)-like protein
MAIQTEAEAALERRRSHILEEINASEPLAGILEEITEMATVMLKGAPCWCETADGARFGSFASEGGKLRIIQQEISTHSGPSLGTIFAGLPLASTPRGNEPEALALAVGLATLAIESRRLYSDLLHRSEFDLLTDVHNRFALDKQVETLIEEARQDAGSFGLIYIDLDKFKQVNDLYGHRVGDGYLQMVALRMKQQLRSHDLLARVGGDEFAVLLPIVHTRAEVEEIAQRMERCFDEPFSIEGQLLSGSASIGAALYPQDGQDKDSLMTAADAAMYETKNSKRQVDRMMAVSRNLQPSPKISH